VASTDAAALTPVSVIATLTPKVALAFRARPSDKEGEFTELHEISTALGDV